MDKIRFVSVGSAQGGINRAEREYLMSQAREYFNVPAESRYVGKERLRGYNFKYLQDRMNERGITVRDAVEILGVPRQVIEGYLNGFGLDIETNTFDIVDNISKLTGDNKSVVFSAIVGYLVMTGKYVVVKTEEIVKCIK